MNNLDIVSQNTSLEIQDIPDVVVTPLVKQEEIVYSTLLAEGDPIANYGKAKEEIYRTGSSTLVTSEKEKATLEQQQQITSSTQEIIRDESIPKEQRLSVMKAYSQAIKNVGDLREKYLVKQTTRDIALTAEDRIGQDIYSSYALERDQKNKQIEAVKAIDNASITISYIFKGVGAVGANISLMIPAGLAAGFAWLKDNDIEKANEVIADITSYAYNPSDVGAQKVINKIQKAMEVIDIPFQYIGDKTLEFTGNPLAATIAYTGTSFIGYIGAGKGLAAGYKAVKKGKPSPNAIDPISTTATANPEVGGQLAAASIISKDTADAMRAKQDVLLNNYVLPKLEEEYGPIQANAIPALEKHDLILNNLYNTTEFDPNVAPVTRLLSERDAYLAIMTEASGPRLNLPSSMLETSVEGLKGKAVFGRNDAYGYNTQLSAEYALEQLKDSTSHLPDPGKFKLLSTDKGIFVEWEFNTKNPDYASHMSLGADSLSAHILTPKWDITRLANSVVGDKIWPAYMRMAEWIPSTGATTAWKHAYVEKQFLQAQRDLFMGTKYPKELSTMLRKGESEGKIYKVEDFQAINQHLTKAQNESLHAAYVGYRRIQDHLYKFADRSFRQKLDRDGFQTLYNAQGQRIGFAKQVEAPIGVSKVWDITNQKVVDTPKDKPILQLHEGVKSGNEILQYAIMDSKFKLETNSAGSLTKIPGYIARHYKEWYVLDKIPKELYVNGYKVGADKLRDYKSAVAMGGTRKEIEMLKQKFALEEDGYIYEWRREEKDIDDKIIHDSKIYDAYLKEIHSRGKALPAWGREADIEDVLVSQTRAIQSVTKVATWDQLSSETKKQWVKAYGKFTQGEFPKEINGIQPLRHMTKEETAEFKAAQKIYQQLEMQQYTSLPSDLIWKNSLHAIADVFEKMEFSPILLREMAQKGNLPIHIAKAFGSNLWLYLRPLRMWAVQPQQWKEMMFLDKSFAKSVHELPSIWMGLISRSKSMENLRGKADESGRRLVKDYDAVIDAMEQSGIMQAVDMNQMIHGLWKDTLEELSPKDVGIVGEAFRTIGQGAKKAVSLPSKVGRAIGYDPAELMNQVSLWSFAKHRWETKNPGKNWNTPENKAQIAQDQARYGHMASTRAGMYSWQEGILSMFTQFAAIPFKSMMQMISAKEFTATEKAKLAAARMFWYGKYGIPLGASIYTLLERNIENEEDRINLDKWTAGFTDHINNSILSAMFDDKNLGENTQADFSKSLSTVPDSIWFYDMSKALYDMSKGEKPETSIPFITAGSAIFQTVQAMHDMYTIPPAVGNERDFADMAWKAVSFAGPLNPFAKFLLEEQLSKNGQSLGYKQTAGEAVARLIGVGPTGERLQFEASKLLSKKEKHIKEIGTDIHNRLMDLHNAKTPEEQVDFSNYVEEMKAFLGSIDETYRDEIMLEIWKKDRYNHISMKDSLMSSIFKKHVGEHDQWTQDAIRKLEKSNDPELKIMFNEFKKAGAMK